MKDRLVDWAYGAGWRLVRALPEPAARRLFSWGATRAYRRDDRGVARLRHNLGRVTGATGEKLETLVQAGMQSYARYWMETFRLPSWSTSDVVDRFVCENPELLQLHSAERGLILALPHSGNWDHAGAWLTLQGFRASTVAERLRPEALFRRFVAYRESLGIEILPATGNGRPVIDVLTERLQSGAVVALIADRDLSQNGIPVSFFGAQSRIPVGPVALALRTGAPLLVASLWYDDERHTHARLTGPIKVPDVSDKSQQISMMCQQVADEFAAGIAAHPADWHMLQRIWLDEE